MIFSGLVVPKKVVKKFFHSGSKAMQHTQRRDELCLTLAQLDVGKNLKNMCEVSHEGTDQTKIKEDVTLGSTAHTHKPSICFGSEDMSELR